MDSNPELKRLYERHVELEELLSEFSGMFFLTPDEEMDEKRLKKEKLCGVDRMMEIVSSCRANTETAAAL